MTVHATAERVDAVQVTARERCVPLTALIELTHRCNLRCRQCYVAHDKGPELSTDEVIKLIDQLEAEGTLYLNLTGGEILLRTDIWEIISYARARHFAVGLLTNGNLIDEAAADRIADLGVLFVGVSVYAHRAELHDAVTGVAGSFEASTRALRLLSARGVSARLKCVLMDVNAQHMEDIMRLAADLGVTVQFDPQLSPRNDGNRAPLQFEADENDLREALAKDYRSQTREQFATEPPCSAGRDLASIGPSGTVYPCLQMPLGIGSVRERPFREIWRESEELATLRAFRMSDVEKCTSCMYVERCRPCLGMNLVENQDIAEPASITCRLTRLRGGMPQKS